MWGPDAAITPLMCTRQWIGILPQFDPKMSPLALLEAEIPSPLYITGNNNLDIIFCVDGGCCCLSLMYGCGGCDGGLDGAIFLSKG